MAEGVDFAERMANTGLKSDILSDLKRACEHLGVAENIINTVSKHLTQASALGDGGPTLPQGGDRAM